MKFLKITLTVFTGAALMMLSACGNKEALPLGQFCWEQTSDYTVAENAVSQANVVAIPHFYILSFPGKYWTAIRFSG